MRNAPDYNWSPTLNLLDERVYVWQPLSILDLGHPLGSNDGIEFLMRLAHFFRMFYGCHNEHLQRLARGVERGVGQHTRIISNLELSHALCFAGADEVLRPIP